MLRVKGKDKLVDKLDWIKELVQEEQKMEESGIVDVSSGFDPDKILREETIEFLKDLKQIFIESASAFNQLKTTTIGHIKIYAISKTVADFMLFRNGYKLVFSAKAPGQIAITFNHSAASFLPGESAHQNVHQDLLTAQWGAFGQVNWVFNSKEIQLDYLVRYYMSRFIKESAK